MTVILRGTCIRAALLDRRSELIRCASITKDGMIQELDDALFKLWESQNVIISSCE